MAIIKLKVSRLCRITEYNPNNNDWMVDDTYLGYTEELPSPRDIALFLNLNKRCVGEWEDEGKHVASIIIDNVDLNDADKLVASPWMFDGSHRIHIYYVSHNSYGYKQKDGTSTSVGWFVRTKFKGWDLLNDEIKKVISLRKSLPEQAMFNFKVYNDGADALQTCIAPHIVTSVDQIEVSKFINRDDDIRQSLDSLELSDETSFKLFVNGYDIKTWEFGKSIKELQKFADVVTQLESLKVY